MYGELTWCSIKSCILLGFFSWMKGIFFVIVGYEQNFTLREILQFHFKEIISGVNWNCMSEQVRITWILSCLQSNVRWTRMLHFILMVPKCSVKLINQIKQYNFKTGVKTFHLVQNNQTIIDNINYHRQKNARNKPISFYVFNVSSLYTNIPHQKLKPVM